MQELKQKWANWFMLYQIGLNMEEKTKQKQTNKQKQNIYNR